MKAQPSDDVPPLVLAGLGKRFGDALAVDGLDLTVARGEVFGFLGPNGAGKTTTIRMLMGLLAPSAGHARIEGHDCAEARAQVVRRTGYLPDSPVFYDYLRGREILEFVGRMHGLPREQIRPAAARLLEELELAEAAERFAMTYSLGMRRKLGLACALIHDPAVLILDEPTNGLDPRAARQVEGRIRAAAAAGKTVFLSTHLLDMAERLCDRVGIIDHGRLVALGTVAELRARQQTGGSLEQLFLSLTGD